MAEDYEKIAISFKALSDPTRLQILRILESGEHSVNEIVDFFTLSQPTISRHLATLANCGLLTSRRTDQQKQYKLNTFAVSELLKAYFGKFDIYKDIDFREKPKSI